MKAQAPEGAPPQPEDSEPYERVLEFVRAEQADAPYAFHFKQQDYRLRTEGGAARSARFPWSEHLLADLETLAQEPPDPDAARRLGEQLQRFLDELDWGGHERSFERAHSSGEALRLVLRSAAAELYALPWELVTLKDSGLHLAELPGCTLRYEWPRERESPPRTVTPSSGRVLFAWSAAGGQVPAEEHLSAIEQACAQGELPFDARRDVLSRVSLSSLEERLESAREPVSVLHVLCHGAPLPAQSSRLYGLAWNGSGEDSDPQVVDAGALAAVLAPHASTLKLVVLCACQGGDAGQMASHLGSVAQALHRADIEMVLASRLPLSAAGSVLLTKTLYQKLLVDSCSLEEALGAARRELRIAERNFDWASLQLYARREGKADLRPVTLRPYCGLLPFGPRHRRFFFGRSKLEAVLLERVQQAAAGQRERFQVVAGASGTGKSSVVMAGLVPLLPAEQWDWLAVRPGELVRTGAPREPGSSRALQELRHRLHRLWSSDPLPAGGAVTVAALVEEVRRLRQARPGKKLLLVADQFEEVFTQLEGDERQALARGLWALARAPELVCVLVATLRVDHFERCGEVLLDEQTRLDSVVYSSEHRLFVAQMEPKEVAEAIEQPARKVGLELEPGLVDRLCKDVGQVPGALPLLAHALDLLWQQREGRQLKHQAYEDLGGVVGALTQTAERLYEELSDSQREHARRLLVRLVAVQEMGSPRARGRVWVEQMQPREEAKREAFMAVLEKLVEHRLLVTGSAEQGEDGEARGSWVQLAHEALLRRWKRLAHWVEQDWEGEQQLRELERWAEDWESHQDSEDRGASYLLAGDRLGYARRLREKIGGELSLRSRRFIEASQGAEERRQQEERARQENEKAMMLALSEARARAARFLGRSFGVLAVLLVLAVAAMAVFADLRRQERVQRRVAQGTARLLWAEQIRQRDPTKALLILREINSQEKPQRWLEAATDVLQQPVARAVLRNPADGNDFLSATFSTDGKQIVTTTAMAAQVWSLDGTSLLRWRDDRIHVLHAFHLGRQLIVNRSSEDLGFALQVWDTQGKRLAKLENPGGWNKVTLSPDGERILASCFRQGYSSSVWLWSTEGKSIATFDAGLAEVHSMVFSPDNRRAAISLAGGQVQVLGENGEPLARMESGEEPGGPLTFSQDGQHLMLVGQKTVSVWKVTGELRARLAGHGGNVLTAAFSPDGQYVVTGSEDKTARVWSVEGQALAQLEHGAPVAAVAVSPEGRRVVTTSCDNGSSLDSIAKVWSTDGKLLARLVGHQGCVLSAAFSPDGRDVLTRSSDHTARLWSLEGTLPEKLEGHEAAVLRASFSPDGTRVVTASLDKTARLWSLEGRQLALLEGDSRRVRSAAFSPDGKQVVTTTESNTAQLWNPEGKLLVTLVGHNDWIRSVAFSPDSQRLVTASTDHTVRLWTADGRPLAVLSGHDAAAVSAAFSPDGKRVVTTSEDTTARIWNVDGSQLALLKGHGDWVVSAAFSPEGQRVLTVSYDKTARIWSLEGRELVKLGGPEWKVNSAAFSPDGQRVVTASENGTGRLWSTAGVPLVTLKGHTDSVLSAAFSPDGQRVVTASLDKTARLWNTDGRLLATLKSDGTVLSAAFSPDGRYVVTASADTTARVWPVDAELVMERLEEATRTCLELEERQLYLDESLEEARSQHERCQRAYGQTPATR
jgi:WD40 repeat protein